ncbi:MAG TPA: PA2779 family protein, partial [Geminicoccaceae bacterium]|nr:PA2779 family protein [Geminicoccaceae bacterium]
MTSLLRFARAIASIMAFVLLLSSLPQGVAQAALVGTSELLDAQAGANRARDGAAQERRKVEAFLQRQDVREQMIAFGVEPEEADARVASLSDREVRQIAGHIDRLPAGQGVIVALIGAAVFVFVVLLITDLLG